MDLARVSASRASTVIWMVPEEAEEEEKKVCACTPLCECVCGCVWGGG